MNIENLSPVAQVFAVIMVGLCFIVLFIPLMGIEIKWTPKKSNKVN